MLRRDDAGEGTVLEIDAGKAAYLILFDGMKTPRRISFRAKLEKR